MDESLEQRGKALEEQFFRRKNEELLEKLRQELAHREQREALKHVSGINDDTTLDALVEHDIGPETLVCVSLIPLVAVAWVDGGIQPEEKQAILNAAEQNHIESSSASYALLEEWMQHKPGKDLLETWHQYMRAIKAKLDPTSFYQMKQAILKRARQIADASGGFWGVRRVSTQEKELIGELESMLDD